MAITKDQIFEVADELDAAGQNPTLAAVRKALGGGSFTTISEAMSEWRARKTAEAVPIREPAPQAVNDKLTELGADLWAVALELANNRLAAEREALEVARADMTTKQQEAAELADQLIDELDAAKARINAQEAAAAAAKTEAAELADKLTAASERAATAEARASELRAELDHAHREAIAVRADHEAALEKAVERVQAERDAALREAKAAREDAAALRGRVEVLESLVPPADKGRPKNENR
jgi:chromosome segregation ATPase